MATKPKAGHRTSSQAQAGNERDVAWLGDIPNVGPAADLRRLGITTPAGLSGRDYSGPWNNVEIDVVKNVGLSGWAKRKVRGKPGQCYRNAWRVVEQVLTDAAYVEGMAVCPGPLVIEHGWVEYQGEIIDPTLVEDGVTYFPGLRWFGRDGLDRACRTPGMDEAGYSLPIFFRFGWGGANSPEMRCARVAAEKHAYGESHSERAYESMSLSDRSGQ